MLQPHPQRPPGTLQERLIAMAKLARRRAEKLPPGTARDTLLRKADMTERTAAMGAWVTSRGAPVPE